MFGAGALMLALVQVGFHLGPMSLLKCQPLKGILFAVCAALSGVARSRIPGRPDRHRLSDRPEGACGKLYPARMRTSGYGVATGVRRLGGIAAAAYP
jgi:hypothetical protein